MERRFVQQQFAEVRLQQRAEGDAGQKIAGYGAVFYDGTEATEIVLWDDKYGRAVERILPGAFNGALSRPDDVRALFNHNTDNVLGRTKSGTLKLSIDTRGLKYEIDPPKTQIAETVMENIRRGDVTGSSFWFNIPNGGEKWISTTDENGRRMSTREISAVELFDVGPVTFPWYDGATAELRSANAPELSDLRKRADAACLPTVIAEAEARAREIELVEAME